MSTSFLLDFHSIFFFFFFVHKIPFYPVLLIYVDLEQVFFSAFISHTDSGTPFALGTLFLEKRGWSSTRDTLVQVPLVSQYLMAHWIFPMDQGCVWCKQTNNKFKAIIWNLIMENLVKVFKILYV